MDNSQSIQYINHTCKNCGAQLEHVSTNAAVITCSYCGTELTAAANLSEDRLSDEQTKLNDKLRAERRAAQQYHRPDHQDTSIPGIYTTSHQSETSDGLILPNQPIISEPQIQQGNGIPNPKTFGDVLKTGFIFGLVLWFIYYVARGFFLAHTKFDLADTPYNNILVSRMFNMYWALRGASLIILSGLFYKYAGNRK